MAGVDRRPEGEVHEVNRRERRVLKRLYSAPAAVHHIIRDTGMGPHQVADAVRVLFQLEYIYRAGQVWGVTRDGHEALLQEASRGDRLVCPGCMRLKISPAHWALRLIGWCDGRGTVG